MIPVQLTIKGLYSYAKSETIDFQPLVAAKLFGIFGPVGSGKSAILEAIMFVLFDRSNRLNKAGDDRYYNMMNLQSNEMIIDFIFNSGRNHKNKYRFYFMARRKAKDFQKVEVRDRSYYQWSKNDWKPMQKSDVLGMTYENFMQTVIIPQGQFREFIDQKPSARTQMLKELFHLDRFDIAPQAYRLLGSVKEQCNFLDGQLSQYSEANKSLLRQLNSQITAIEKSIDEQTSKEQKLTDQIGQLNILQHIFSELMEVSENLNTLKSEDAFYQKKQHQLNRFLKVQALFEDKIMQQKQLLVEAKARQDELGALVKEINQMEHLVIKAKKQWTQAQNQFAQKDKISSKITDLELLVQLKTTQEKFSNALSQLEQTQKQLLELNSKVDEVQLGINKSREAIAQKSTALEQLQKLKTIENWWDGLSEGKREQNLLQNEQTSLKTEILNLSEKTKGLKSKIKDPDNLRKRIASEREILQSLNLQEDWRKHASLLEEGKPCPLCGAISHPKPLSEEKLSKALDEARENLKNLESALETQRSLDHQCKIFEIKIDERNQRLVKLNQKLASNKTDLKKHLDNYPGSSKPANRPGNIEQQIPKLEQMITVAENEETLLKEWVKKEEDMVIQLGQKQKVIHDLALKKEKFEGEMNQMTRSFQSLDPLEFSKKSKPEIDDLIAGTKSTLNSIDLNYKKTLDYLNKSEQQLNHQKGLLQSLELQVEDIEASSKTLETELQALCKKESFKGLKEVQRILALDLKVESERTELEKYRTDLHTYRVRKQKLQKQIGKKQYSEAQHRELVVTLDNIQAELHQLRNQLSGKQHTQKQLQFQLQKKVDLNRQLQDLSVRKDHIQEISNLLRGNGFINFISSVYLQNLCKAANERFTKLTGNQLSLELSEQNEFLVRDFLNDGKLRLLKTLSGGQIFQASLCLALSLAENVKNLNQADKSFFFLDEGFGSLDRRSLQLVFETLKSLQKENRIVGVISHVEDLQMEIDTYLSVQQHQDGGSTISRSWE